MDDTEQQKGFIGFLRWLGDLIWVLWGEPILTFLGLYEPKDRTYGRWDVPFSKMEQRLHENPDVSVSFHRAFFPNGKDWVWYQVWEDKLAQRATGRRADMIFVHGTGVHSGTLASHSRRYLDAGFRLIVPDLVSHGYSTGLHVYQRYLTAYTSGLNLVLRDVAKRDDEAAGSRPAKKDRRRTFMLGLSFGGLLAIQYPLHFPTCAREDTTDMDDIPVDGIIPVGPILDYSKDHIKIGAFVHSFTAFIEMLGAGRLELFVPHKKVLDKDPKVYKTLVDSDMRSHRGAFRVGHLLALRDGIEEVQRRAPEFRHPIYIQHGAMDRVVTIESSREWLRRCNSEDVKMSVYPVCQHVIYKKGKTETEDKAGRVAVLEDNVAWMSERSPGQGHIDRGLSFSSDVARSASFSSGVNTPDIMTPSDSMPATPAAQEHEKDPSENVVQSTINSLTNTIDNAIENAAVASAVQTGNTSLTKRHDVKLPLEPPPVPPPTEKKVDRHAPEWVEQRNYRPNWTLPEEIRPYDIVF